MRKFSRRPPLQGVRNVSNTKLKHFQKHTQFNGRLSLLAICLVIFFMMAVIIGQLGSSSSQVSMLRVIGNTKLGSPILEPPLADGYARVAKQNALNRIRIIIDSGVRLKYNPKLYRLRDSKHFHGLFIGTDPNTGLPDWTPSSFDFDKETDDMKTAAHTQTCFNVRRSDSLPLDRTFEDPRIQACHSQWYYQQREQDSGSTPPTDKFLNSEGVGSESNITTTRTTKLPTTSVVFVFYNEPLSTLLRAMHSVLNRTPPDMLHEIILVDDGSDAAAPWLLDGAQLEKHLQLLPKTKLVRLEGRNGLMQARNVGASVATGDTLTFLDSHIEVAPGWLEPLMGRIAEGLEKGIHRVVVPVIDSIHADNFEYTRGGIDVLGHTWGLGQVGVPNLLNSSNPNPVASPIMAGGLLSLSREYFDKLGFYDPEMQLWGGEEMEISFRIWLCGGTLECVPCSHVGHVFRSSKYWQGQVYKVPGDVIARNKLRASYWMDDYSQLMKLSTQPLPEGKTIGSMDHYEEIRKRLQCKRYSWYLKNVYPQMLESAKILLPKASDTTLSDADELLQSNFKAYGYMRNMYTNTCLDTLHHKDEGSIYGVFYCHFLKGSQSALLTKNNLVLSGDRLLNGCLTRDSSGKLVSKKYDDRLAKQQKWEINAAWNESEIYMKGEGKCLTVVKVTEEENKSPYSLRMEECEGEGELRQRWSWETITNGAVPIS